MSQTDQTPIPDKKTIEWYLSSNLALKDGGYK